MPPAALGHPARAEMIDERLRASFLIFIALGQRDLVEQRLLFFEWPARVPNRQADLHAPSPAAAPCEKLRP